MVGNRSCNFLTNSWKISVKKNCMLNFSVFFQNKVLPSPNFAFLANKFSTRIKFSDGTKFNATDVSRLVIIGASDKESRRKSMRLGYRQY